jgi:protein involved in polysaccharide export with SLBB domain
MIAPGDVLQVHIYGATTLDQQVTVDGNGEIFLPSVGPVHVAGITAGELQAAVSAAVASVYQKNSQVYVTLSTAVPINVFVTGAVMSPSQYSLPSTASVITFLQAAGGINPTRGSYRDIQILRDGRPIATADLYDFLLRGRLPSVRLRDRDTILVRQQGPTVAALGAVRGVFRYEIEKPRTGEELIALARPLADATHVSLLGIRGGRPESFYFTLSAFRSVPLRDGDIVTFSPDVPTGVMTVKLDGRIDGPTTLVVSRTATLLDVLAYVPVDTYFADTSSIYVRRLSVAQAQKKSIDDALHRLESAVVTSPTITAEQAQMRQQEAQIIFTFGKQLADVQPEGRLVVSYDGHLSNVRLEDGDVIVVPSRTDLVLISGEVRVPQSLVWIRGAPVGQYIETAGGFTERADTSNLLVIRPSGQTIVGSNPPILAGDRIIVLPSPSNWALPFIKDITQIIYQVAVGVGVLLRL